MKTKIYTTFSFFLLNIAFGMNSQETKQEKQKNKKYLILMPIVKKEQSPEKKTQSPLTNFSSCYGCCPSFLYTNEGSPKKLKNDQKNNNDEFSPTKKGIFPSSGGGQF